MDPLRSSPSGNSPGNRIDPEARLRIINLTRSTDLATRAEIATASAARRKGLLGRTGLPDGGGLWIVPCESVHTFFMKFPIDLIYIDRKSTVKKVRRNVSPWRLSACLSAHSIIELPAGVIDRSQTIVGDRLELIPAEPVAEI
ncbi:MAG TPA: DUF192 domain-containing protein [Acidobacteriaceae bacterium]|nr:DUF192 domain-containing protein [Acidobacteriaceae bacterium]